MNAMYMYRRSWAPHLRTFLQTYEITPALLSSSHPRDACPLAIALCRRVRHLVADIERAIYMHWNHPSRQKRGASTPWGIIAPSASGDT